MDYQISGQAARLHLCHELGADLCLAEHFKEHVGYLRVLDLNSIYLNSFQIVNRGFY